MKAATDISARGLVLGIETATVFGGVALVSDTGDMLGEITLCNRASHSERILPAVESLLAAVGFTLRELKAVAVSRGPGSFTGLRAGIATAKGLAFSLGVPLYGVPTLEVLAANAAPGEGPVCAVINARRGEVFRALFRQGLSGLERFGQDGIVPLDSLACELPAGCLVIGELPPQLIDQLTLGGAVRLSPRHLSFPRAAVLAFRGLVMTHASLPSELATLRPGYLRPCGAKTWRGTSQIACTDEGLRGTALR